MKKISDSEFSARMCDLHPNVEVLGEYTNIRTKIRCRCATCENEWHTTPKRLFVGQGCPRCAYSNMRTTTDEFRKALSEISPHIEHLEEYPKNNSIKTMVKCHNCSRDFMSRPAHLLSGYGCPNCSKKGYKSGISGFLYVILFDDFIKYGITNNVKNRLRTHMKQGMKEVIECYQYSDGRIPVQLENLIRTTIGGKYVSKETLQDGWTETLSIDKLEEIRALVESSI